MADDDNKAYNTSVNRVARMKTLASQIYNKLNNYSPKNSVEDQTKWMESDLREVAGWANSLADDIWYVE